MDRYNSRPPLPRQWQALERRTQNEHRPLPFLRGHNATEKSLKILLLS